MSDQPIITTVAAATPDCTRKGEGDVIELTNGCLLLIYMEFREEGSDDAPSRFVAEQSADGGLTWERHRVVANTLAGDVNVYSPNLIRSMDGGILLIFMRKHTKQLPVTTLSVWKSTDEGETFRPFSEFAQNQNFYLCNAVVKRLHSNRLLLPVETPALPIVEGAHISSHPYDATVMYSDDDGLTWNEADNRLSLPLRGASEPHVEETRDNRVLMVMRNQLGALYISESKDSGKSWSKPQTTGLRSPESCPSLTRIPETGDLLVIWNNSLYDPSFASHYGKRSPLTVAVSKDEGRTWRHVRNLEDDPGRAYSNPGCRFVSQGVRGMAIINYWTCVYTRDWRMQDVIDLRVALVPTSWFYQH